jgi:hypothetical protein
LNKNKKQKAVDAVCDRAISRVVKARRAGEGMEKGSKPRMFPDLRLAGHQGFIEKSVGNRMLEAYHKGHVQH